MGKIKMEEVRKIKEGTAFENTKTNAKAVVVDNFGGGVSIEVMGGKANMSYEQMYNMLNNEYTNILEAK